MNRVILGDNLQILPTLPDASIPLIYIDPPFNTGEERTYTRIKTVRDEAGDRQGFQNARFRTVALGTQRYLDVFDEYLDFIAPRLEHAHRLLAETGTLYFHIDYREAHYCKVLLDTIFGRECFLNEIVWAYDYGGKPKTRWPAKHDTILVYVKDPKKYFFDAAAVERIPYMAPSLVTAEKAARGKMPTDVWWHTIVPTNGKERTGYPTQKPEGILRRILQASSRPGDTVLDFFAGSGTTGAVAHSLGREFILIDDNPDAIAVIRKRFADVAEISWEESSPEKRPEK